ncbi:anthocyanidin 3-O-glucosyltransferase 7-like [Magnolia sinica]|uniref:anthocyanidin 3-O-glucosyltransferase 7-like n=1 Tax=Magnolia sinica TaxID=86752 RepID=UPI00265A56E2|nr:anthocyanidin 3-O-glucosyltransferase 7-like [Magnolia sinica]
MKVGRLFPGIMVSNDVHDDPLDFVAGFSVLRVGDLTKEIVFGDLKSFFSCLLHRMGEESARAMAVVLNTFDGLDSTTLTGLMSKFRSCLAVGSLNLISPLLSEDSHACLIWLDRFAHNPASIAYVGFGMVMRFTPVEVAALAEGLESSGAPFIWSLKAREGFPAGFLEQTAGKGLIVPWALQSMVLGHVAMGVHVTHDGWNSMMESIAGTVPMICYPTLADYKLNNRLVSHAWRIGVEVDGGVLTRDEVVNSIELVLRKDEGRVMRERACKLRELGKESVGNGSSVEIFNKLLGILLVPGG